MKFTVNLVCNVIMNTSALVIMGYIADDVVKIKIVERIIKTQSCCH